MAAYGSAYYPNQTGAVTTYAVPFEYLSADDVTVEVAGSPVAFTFISSGVVSVTPAPVGDVYIYRTTDLGTAVTDFKNGAGLLASDLNSQVDQLLFAMQEASDAANVALRIPEGERDVVSVILPSATERAGRTLVFASDGSVDVSSDSYVDNVALAAQSALEASQSATTASTKADEAAQSAEDALEARDEVVGISTPFTQSFLGATDAKSARTLLKAEGGGSVTLEDFGGVADGVTDNSGAWNAFLTWAATSNVRRLQLGHGFYNFTSAPNPINIEGLEVFGRGQSAGGFKRSYTPASATDGFITIAAYGAAIRNTAIVAGDGHTGGYAIKNHWNATDGAGDYIRIEDVYLSYESTGRFTRGISFDGSARTSLVGSRDAWITNCSIFGATEASLYFKECIALCIDGVNVFDGGVTPSIAGLVVTGASSKESQYVNMQFGALSSASIEHTNGFILNAANAGTIVLASTCNQGSVFAPRVSSITNNAGPTKVSVFTKDAVYAAAVGTGASSDLTLTTSGGTQARVKHRSSAVNHLSIQGAATNGYPVLSSEDSTDTNVWTGLKGKGNAGVFIDSTGSGATPSLPSDYGAFLWPDSTGTVQIGAYSSGGTADLEFYVCSSAGTLTQGLGIKSDGTVDIRKAATNATTPSNFVASKILTVQINGVTHYIPCSTAVW